MICEYCGVNECPAAEHNENCPLYKEYHKFLNTMKGKTTILLEDDLFSEDQMVDTKSIISNYFDVKRITLEKALLQKDVRDSEGYVIRSAKQFNYFGFRNNVMKYVRKNHVTSATHWKFSKIDINKLMTEHNIGISEIFKK